MKRIEGLKKPVNLPGPTARPRTLATVPPPAQADAEITEGESSVPAAPPAPALTPVEDRPSPAQDPETSTETVQEPKAEGRSKKRAEKQPPRPKVSSTAETMKSVSVSVPFTLAEAWRDRAKNDRTSQVEVLFDAIVANQSALSSVVAAASERPTVSDGLFDRGTGGAGERFVGVSLRIKSTNLTVIDNLAERHGPVKRSPFVAAVLSAYLDLGNEG
ncbi:hypothetical protein [Nocardioides sp. PD653]|uniref:hypothetical protein n=2 Tax=unclassified Nocardioides TaxID=2615069 RepID=UPI001F623DEF|nr:hypothetical protein [Nocardioides sp. PD653]